MSAILPEQHACWDVEAAREFSRAGIWSRAWGGLRRRLSPQPSALHPAVEASVQWLRTIALPGGLPNLAADGQEREACQLATAAGIKTLTAYGELELARRWFDEFSKRRDLKSLACTGRFIAAAVALLPDREVIAALARAGNFAARALDDSDSPSSALAWIGELLAAANALNEPGWRAVAERFVGRATRDEFFGGGPPSRTTDFEVLIALVKLRMNAAVKAPLDRLATVPLRNLSPTNLGLSAHLWSLIGETQSADRALSLLASQRSWTEVGACLAFLDAVQARVAAAFAGTADEVPARIDSRDGRARAVRAWAASLPPTSRVADVGCGRGRYLGLIEDARPSVRLTAIDPSATLLACIPSRIACRAGSLLRLPAADGEFDAALAVESLEHSLLPERAVAELARVVRTGGTILIIDKDRAYQARSQHAPWECWFAPAEMNAWLARHCDDITAEPIPHGPAVKPDGLYWQWQARRR